MAARMTHQIEEASAKQEYFSSLTDELWFEYTVQPSAISLSHGACDQTGLPAVIVDPQSNSDFIDAGGRRNGACVTRPARLAVVG